MEPDQKIPAVRATRLQGINLRSGRHALEAGEFDRLQGLYPFQTGLQRRISGKRIYRYLAGQSITALKQTFDGSGNIIVQAGATIQLYTLDEFLNRSTTPVITQSQTEEENFGMAIILHDDSNLVTGGSSQGYLTAAADSTAVSDTFYPRRLSAIEINETKSALLTVNTFKAASIIGGVATVTMTIATPAVVSLTAHNLTAGSAVIFQTTGALPTGVTSGTTYYVIAAGLTADAFEFSASIGGAAINTSGSQSGTHRAMNPGYFILVPGTYRLMMWMTYYGIAADCAVQWGLFNVTSNIFEVYSGTGVAILSQAEPRGTSSPVPNSNFLSCIECNVRVTSVAKTYQIRHKSGGNTATARSNNFCGDPVSMTGANVNGSAARNTYGLIQIIRIT